jgi:hypothetical protein
MHRRTPLRDEDQLSDVTVDGERWTRVPDVSNSGPEDRVYSVNEDDSGGSWIRFGDGTHGKRPASGSSVAATYRAGPNQVQLTLTRTASSPTPDVDLWLVIKNGAEELSFGQYSTEQTDSADHVPHGGNCTRPCILGILVLFLLLVLLITGR